MSSLDLGILDDTLDVPPLGFRDALERAAWGSRPLLLELARESERFARAEPAVSDTGEKRS